MAKGWNKLPECRQPEFGELVRLWRERQGLTQQQVANMIGMHKSSISRLESGEECSCLKSPQRRALIDLIAPPENVGSPKLTLTRRRLLKVGFLLPTTRVMPTLSPPRPEQSWDHWLEVAKGLTRQGDHLKAWEAYGLALDLARPVKAARSAAALAAAHRALSACELSNLDDAVKEARLSHELLELAEACSPNKCPIVAQPADEWIAKFVTRGLRDERAAEAYALQAQALGRVAREQRRNENDALACFNALGGIGRLQNDRRKQADSAHFIAYVYVDLGTRLAKHTPEWKEVKSRANMLRAREGFLLAKELRPVIDEVMTGYDWRGISTVLHILGEDDTDEARRAAAEAMELLSAGRGLASLLLDRGRRLRSAGDDRGATVAFEDAVALGLQYESPFLLADSFSKLAEIAVARSDDSRDGLDYAAAAIVAWPSTSYLGDRVRVDQLFARLWTRQSRSADALDNLLEGSAVPLTILRNRPWHDRRKARSTLKNVLAMWSQPQ